LPSNEEATNRLLRVRKERCILHEKDPVERESFFLHSFKAGKGGGVVLGRRANSICESEKGLLSPSRETDRRGKGAATSHPFAHKRKGENLRFQTYRRTATQSRRKKSMGGGKIFPFCPRSPGLKKERGGKRKKKTLRGTE